MEEIISVSQIKRFLATDPAKLLKVINDIRMERDEALELLRQAPFCPHFGVPEDWEWDGARWWCESCHEYVRSEREFLLAGRVKKFLAKFQSL